MRWPRRAAPFRDAADTVPWLSDGAEVGQSPLPATEPLGGRDGRAGEGAGGARAPHAAPPFAAFRAAWAGDEGVAVAALMALPPSERLATDPHGHTPLHAAALAGRARAVAALLAPPLSLPPDTRSAAGWTALDVAVSQGHTEAAEVLAAAGAARAKARRAERRADLAAMLASSPDYHVRVKWELTSPLLGPLLRAAAPGDTYSVWKRGAAVRVDGALRGLESGGAGVGLLPEWRRGPFSVVWAAGDGPAAGDDTSGDGGSPASAPSPPPPPSSHWLLIDRAANSYVDLAAEHRAKRTGVEADAARALRDGGRRTKITAAGARLAPARGWLGGAARPDKVAGLVAILHEARVGLAAVDAVRARWPLAADASFEDYLSFTPPPDAVSRVPIDPLGAAGVPGRGGDGRGGDRDRALVARVWLAPSSPLPAAHLFALLDVAGGANRHLASAGRIARRLAGGAEEGLPVRLAVPLGWTVSATVTALSVSPLAPDAPACTEAGFFGLPAGCRAKNGAELAAARRARAAAAATARGRHAGSVLPEPPKTPGRSPIKDGYEDLQW
jgi:hypothetical protein